MTASPPRRRSEPLRITASPPRRRSEPVGITVAGECARRGSVTARRCAGAEG